MKKIAIFLSAASLLAGCGDNGRDGLATGTFDAVELIVSNEVPGKIVRLDVSEGDAISDGQLIGLMDTVQLDLQMRALLKNIDAMYSQRPDIGRQLAPYRQRLSNEQNELNRLKRLVESDAATQKQLDDAVSAVEVARKQLEAQENTLGKSVAGLDAQIAAARIQAEQISDQIARCRIMSPISGTVVAKYAQAGELAAQGRPLIKLADTDNIFLRAYLTASQLTDIKIGQKVDVSADFGAGNYRQYDGIVTWISDRSEFTPKNIVTSDDRANMVYAVKVAIKNDGYAKMGMYGEVRFK